VLRVDRSTKEQGIAVAIDTYDFVTEE